MDEKWELEPMEIFGKRVLFTDARGASGESKLYVYDLRHGDDWGTPVTLEKPGVIVNWFGRVYSPVKLLEDGEDYRTLTEEDWGYLEE